MIVYLAGMEKLKKYFYDSDGRFDSELASRINMLTSVYYVQPWQLERKSEFKRVMVDSGAFTFREKNADIDFTKFTDNYAELVSKYEIERFFEVDVDSLIGYDAVLKLRERLESQTGRKCIPVWHAERGIREFERMCDEYDYVAIGGIAGRKAPATMKALPKLIKVAHKHGAKIHGLGFTGLGYLKQMTFDSVDSTAWTAGNRFGFVSEYKNGVLTHVMPKRGEKLDTEVVLRNNLDAWVRIGEDYERGIQVTASSPLQRWR